MGKGQLLGIPNRWKKALDLLTGRVDMLEEANTKLNSDLTPSNLTLNTSSTFLDTNNSNIYCIKSGNIISFSGRIVTARQTTTSDLSRICVIQNTSLMHTTSVITDNDDVSQMYVNTNGELYLAMNNLPVGTTIRFNACLIAN